MNKLNDTYLRYIPHPDEPELTKQRDFRTDLTLQFTNRNRLKKQIFGKPTYKPSFTILHPLRFRHG